MTIGKRPGEKLYEELITEDEIPHVEETSNMYILRPGLTTPTYVAQDYAGKLKIHEYSSKTVKLLGKEEIKKILLKELHKDNIPLSTSHPAH